MRTVALEEHFSAPALAKRIDPKITSARGFRPRNLTPGAPNPMELLPEIGETRLKSMDDAGITVQVLSNAGPAADLIARPRRRGAGARDQRSPGKAAIARHPGRFAGFAALPLQSPDAAPAELGAR